MSAGIAEGELSAMQRRAIVLIEWGPLRWQKALIAPGKTLRVGRLERADLVVPHDDRISGLHFELAWDGARCTVRDLASQGGTQLNGERVASGEVGHAEWIRAGRTVFSIYHEGVAPPWAPERGAARVSPEHKARALEALRAGEAPLYAVLDAAREPRILTLLRSCPEQVQSLYEGLEGEELEEVAPYLVALPRGSWLLEKLVEEGWGERWGIYLTCRRPFKEVRRQLRRLLVVTVKEDDEQLYLRFYDPSVLARTMAACSPRQRQLAFGEIEAFVTETDAGEALWTRAAS
jgi:hypothetical protein